MNEEFGSSNADINSPILGGNNCDYYYLKIEVQSYWIEYYKNKLNLKTENGLITPSGLEGKDEEFEGVGTIKKYSKEEEKEYARIMTEFDDGVFSKSQLKTEEYFKELWRNICEVGFEREDRNHCIETCKTLIREEVDWWKEREDLKEHGALKVPLLIEYFSWYVIWKQCKYDKLIVHPLHNYASKKQSVLKKNLPTRKVKKSISLNLQKIQFPELYEGLKRIGAIDKATSLSVFKNYLNGSEINSVVTPIKFKNSSYVSVFIYLCEEYGLQDQKEYFKWKEFFGIDPNYAKKQVSSYKNNHLGIPPYYHQMREVLEGIGCKLK